MVVYFDFLINRVTLSNGTCRNRFDDQNVASAEQVKDLKFTRDDFPHFCVPDDSAHSHSNHAERILANYFKKSRRVANKKAVKKTIERKLQEVPVVAPGEVTDEETKHMTQVDAIDFISIQERCTDDAVATNQRIRIQYAGR